MYSQFMMHGQKKTLSYFIICFGDAAAYCMYVYMFFFKYFIACSITAVILHAVFL